MTSTEMNPTLVLDTSGNLPSKINIQISLQWHLHRGMTFRIPLV